MGGSSCATARCCEVEEVSMTIIEYYRSKDCVGSFDSNISALSEYLIEGCGHSGLDVLLFARFLTSMR